MCSHCDVSRAINKVIFFLMRAFRRSLSGVILIIAERYFFFLFHLFSTRLQTTHKKILPNSINNFFFHFMSTSSHFFELYVFSFKYNLIRHKVSILLLFSHEILVQMFFEEDFCCCCCSSFKGIDC